MIKTVGFFKQNGIAIRNIIFYLAFGVALVMKNGGLSLIETVASLCFLLLVGLATDVREIKDWILKDEDEEVEIKEI